MTFPFLVNNDYKNKLNKLVSLLKWRKIYYDYFVPLGFNFLFSSSGFSFLGLLISLGMMSSKGLNKTYEKKHFKDIIPV